MNLPVSSGSSPSSVAVGPSKIIRLAKDFQLAAGRIYPFPLGFPRRLWLLVQPLQFLLLLDRQLLLKLARFQWNAKLTPTCGSAGIIRTKGHASSEERPVSSPDGLAEDRGSIN